jgi:WD40 repeat protein
MIMKVAKPFKVYAEGFGQNLRQNKVINMQNMRKLIFTVIIMLFASFSLRAQDIAVFPQLGHTLIVRTVAICPDDAYILSAEADTFINLWEVKSGRILRTFWGHNANISALAFSPNGKTFVSGDQNGIIKLWDTGTGKELCNLSGHSDRITSLVYSPDGKQVLSASYDTTITIWDAQSGEELKLFGIGDFAIASAFYSPDGKYIVSASTKNLLIWDAAAGKRLKTLAEGKSFRYASCSLDGKKIVSTDDGGIITVWNVDTGRTIRSIASGDRDRRAVAYISANRLASWSSEDIKFWDPDTGQKIKEIEHHGGYIMLSGPEEGRHSAAFSRNGRLLAAGTEKGVYVMDRESGEILQTLAGTTDFVRATRFSPDGKRIIFEVRKGSESGIWDITSGKLQKGAQGNGGIFSQAYSYDGTKTVSIFLTRDIVTIHEAKTRKELQKFEQEDASFESAAFSPDGKQVVIGGTGDAGGNIKIWEPGLTGNGKIIRSFGRDDTYSVTYSPDGKRIVSGHNRDIKIWNMETGRELGTLRGHKSTVFAVAFSPDGRYIASGSYDTTIRIWDAQTSKEVLCISDTTGAVLSVAFSPDGRRLVAGSRDGSVYLYDVSGMDRGLEVVSRNRRIVQLVLFSGADSAISSATRGLTVETETAASSVDGEWVAITHDGYYQASPRGDRYLNVRVGNTVSGIDSYRSIFYNPDVVQARLNGRPDPASKASVTIQQAASFLPPELTLTASSVAAGGTANLSVSVTDKNQPIKNIKIMVNGRLLGRDELSAIKGAPVQPQKASLTVTGNQKTISFTLPLNLEPGPNRVEAVAFNGYSESRRYVDITWNAPAGQRQTLPNLWILAVGVNKYADSRIRSLNYCVADAKSVVDSLKTQEGKRYGKVNSLLIADGERLTPTAENIRRNLKFLEGAGPRDVVLLFLAGHGVSDNAGTFLFLPGDTRLRDDKTVNPATAITGSEIVSVLDAPGNRLVFIDACQSGGVDNDRLVRSLMDTNAFVFTSSKGTELSQERPEFGHGVFTYSILSALKGNEAAQTQGNVSVLGLSGFVSLDVPRITNNEQHPGAYSLGFYDFPLARIK